ncbi:MAG TPA: hypothetical protein DEF05_00610 [Erwinia sp.]|uniref:hypothetical protein n=1 Tax=Erwinia citreus TaxID=558 RepID=UPI000E98DA3F|nr:hypothetical protein [Erwinia sp.]HBV38208.1 hypothetical protein [Erwinia sp.]
MNVRSTGDMADIEWAVGSAVRSLLARNAEIIPTNILAELVVLSSSRTPAEVEKINVAIGWIRTRIN